MDKEFKDEDYFDDENRTIKSYLKEQYELKLKDAIEKEEYENAAHYKKIIDKLNGN